MATPAQIEAKVARGYGIAAKHLGDTCDWYRCANTGPVIVSGNKRGTLPANFTPAFTYMKNQAPGKNGWLALVDGTQVQQGDYLVDPVGVAWYIGALRPLLPPGAVQCNRVASFKRPSGSNNVGLSGYGGDIADAETVLATGWPISILAATRRGEKTDAKLPGDETAPWWDVLAPAIPGLTLRPFDIITDDLNRRGVISSAELTPENGWRLSVAQQVT
jgi:hypothetical protein